MRHTVGGERDLPHGRQYQYFLRSLSDPTVYIGGDSGDTFVRLDGKRWKNPAVEIRSDGDQPSYTPRGAWGDRHIYPYRGEKNG